MIWQVPLLLIFLVGGAFITAPLDGPPVALVAVFFYLFFLLAGADFVSRGTR